MEVPESRRLIKEIVLASINGAYSNKEAGRILNLDPAYIAALKRKYHKEGDSAFIHKNTGKKPPNAISEEVKAQIIAVRKMERDGKPLYANTNYMAFKDILADVYGISLAKATLSKILNEAGFESPNKRANKNTTNRQNRREIQPQKETFGELFHFIHMGLNCVSTDTQIYALLDDATGIPVGAAIGGTDINQGFRSVYTIMNTQYSTPKAIYFHDEQAITNNSVLAEIGHQLRDKGIDIEPGYTKWADRRIQKFWRFFLERLSVEIQVLELKSAAEVDACIARLIKKLYPHEL